MQSYGFSGLDESEVRSRKANGQQNIAETSVSKSTKDIIISNVFTYFNFIFMVITVLICIVGSFRNLTFLPIVIGNTLIGIYQELKARKVIEKMNLLNAPHAVAIRDGSETRVRARDLVKDDVVIFSAGDQICADARVLEGTVAVNESMLTGEEDEITKTVGDQLLSGSFIVSGECCAVLEKVGNECYIQKLTAQAKKMRDGEQSEMIRSINKLVKWMGIILIPIGGVLFYQGYYVNHEGFAGSVVSTVAAVIGMIPEGLYLLTTVALALGTIRLAKRKVLLNDMKSIEALARVDVLCVDKTGTITEPKMEVRNVVPLDKDETASIEDMLFCYVSASHDQNATMSALRDMFCRNGFLNEPFVPSDVVPFSSSLKYGVMNFENGTWILGAPEFVLKDKIGAVKDEMAEYAKKGYRVLVFARQEEPVDPQNAALSANVEPKALIVLSNSIRKNAKATFKYFEKQDVTVKVISGDNPETVAEIARLAGIKNAGIYVDASTLDTEEKLFSAAAKYTVFGRVTPKQKQFLVRALKKQGHTVAMTGDGVNDILALKDADCGIAMASGSEAVSQVAEVVLMDSDFARMPKVVSEGRRVVNNIQRSASLFLVKNIFSLLLSITAAVFSLTYPLEPAHISLISMFTIGIPGFLLALESNNSRISGNFLKKVLKQALPAGLTDAFIVGSLAIFGDVFGMSKGDVATSATLVLAVVGFMILRRISLPMNTYRIIVFIINIVGLLLCFFLLPGLFSIVQLPASIVQLTVVFSFAAESLLRILTLFTERWAVGIKRRFLKRSEKKNK